MSGLPLRPQLLSAGAKILTPAGRVATTWCQSQTVSRSRRSCGQEYLPFAQQMPPLPGFPRARGGCRLPREREIMRALVVPEFGSAEVLKLEEVPDPTPEEHDLLVEVHACALNPIDFKVRRGALAKGRKLPIILGFDVSGVVRGLGKSVSGFRVGDEVYAAPSLVRNGANAEFVCVDARTAALKPKSLDHVHAAALPLVTLTVWEALLLRARVQSGETVLIHAGGGGVGHVAVQLAKLHGCRVLTTASRPESLQLCRQLGADVVINYRETDFVERVKKETAGRRCPVVFDTVGGETFDRSLECVAPDGRLVTCVGTPSDKIPEKLFRLNATLF